MCCDNRGETADADGVCESCGELTAYGMSKDICCYSPQICEECENAPCDGSC